MPDPSTRTAGSPQLAFRQRGLLVAAILALVVGGLVGLAAVVFLEAISWVQLLALGTREEMVISGLVEQPWWRRLAGPLIGGVIVGGLMTVLYPTLSRPPGVANVIAASALRRGRMSFRDGIKAASLNAISLGFGASVGREGPMVHWGATIGAWGARALGLDPRIRRTLLACGVSAAVAASFNAPLAGVFFALEVVVGHYAFSLFAPCVLAALAATLVGRAVRGDDPAFIMPEIVMAGAADFPLFGLLGGFSGLVAVLFIVLTFRIVRLADHLSLPWWSRPAIAGLIVGLIAIQLPQVLGIGYEATQLTLAGQYGLLLLVAVLAGKIVCAAACQGLGFGGGVFSPSLLIGAALGATFGQLVGLLPWGTSDPSAYAIVGMGATAAAVLGAPISTVLMVFELTGSYPMAVGSMVAVVFAVGLARAITGHSFFTRQLQMLGLDIRDGKDVSLLQNTQVSEILDTDVDTVPPTMPAPEVLDRLIDSRWGRLFVVSDTGKLEGFITLETSRSALKDPENTAADVALDALYVTANCDLTTAMKRFVEKGEAHVPVVTDEASNRLIGLIHDFDVSYAYHRAMLVAEGQEDLPVNAQWSREKRDSDTQSSSK
ncbi:MAG: chloride channel protein [Alphaproteobacteria bacterium]|jgi:chloride channel protein, CIC family|nr:chloride channel protein [Alphaproteobacteria bacterium]